MTTENPQTYIICPYCKEKMIGSYDQDKRIIYSCTNHKPLIVDYYYTNVPVGKWIIDSIIISNSNSFRLCNLRNSMKSNFYLQEYEKEILGQRTGGWFGYRSTAFSVEWVLSQKPEKILSILEMYKLFS